MTVALSATANGQQSNDNTVLIGKERLMYLNGTELATS